MSADPPIPACPACRVPARRTRTRYGLRDACDPCGLWSWHGKPLVSAAVHQARNACHEVVDPLWQNAERAYVVTERPGTPEHDRAVKRIRRAARSRTYAFIADALGIPEPDAHMADQDDLDLLRRIRECAETATPEEIREWAKARKPAA